MNCGHKFLPESSTIKNVRKWKLFISTYTFHYDSWRGANEFPLRNLVELCRILSKSPPALLNVHILPEIMNNSGWSNNYSIGQVLSPFRLLRNHSNQGFSITNITFKDIPDCFLETYQAPVYVDRLPE